MSSQRSVYVSIRPGVYRDAKSNLLSSQAGLLKVMKTLHNLRILARKRKDLRNKLIRLMEQVVREVGRIENKFPVPVLPKKYKRGKNSRSKRKGRKVSKPDVNMKRDYSKKQAIDQELFEIQRKLNSLA